MLLFRFRERFVRLRQFLFELLIIGRKVYFIFKLPVTLLFLGVDFGVEMGDLGPYTHTFWCNDGCAVCVWEK